MPPQQSRYFPALTGLRALLAWDVFLFHYGESQQRLGQHFIAGGGEVGVSLFFLLSGFLIAHQYEGRLSAQRRFLGRYFYRRWTRIYPLYFFISVLSLLLLLLWWTGERAGLDFHSVLLHLTLLKGFFQEEIFRFIGPAWSLTVEECFYAAAPFMILLRRKVALHWQCLFIAAAGMGLVRLSRAAGSTDFMHEYNFMFYWTFFGRAFQFCCGIALAAWMRRRKEGPARRFPALTLAGAAVLPLSQCLLYPLHQVAVFGSPDALAIAFNNIVIPLLGLLLFWGLLTEKSLLRRILESRLFALLGRSSFAFYLLHLSPLILLPKRQFLWPPLVSFAVTQLLSILLYRLLEDPLHRALNRWWNRRRAAAEQRGPD